MQARPEKSLNPRSLRIFRELQNSRVFDPFKHAAIRFAALHSASCLFSEKPSRTWGFSTGFMQTVRNPGNPFNPDNPGSEDKELRTRL